MESCLRFSVILVVVCFASSIFAAPPAAGQPAQTEVSTTDTNLPPMPFIAEITSDNIYVRSGAGTNYYDCGKLKTGDKVKVVGSRYSWLQIVPPAGSYAWISKQYVQVEPPNSAGGTVIGEGVRVYVGSDDVQPMHSMSLLVKLNKGDTVSLLGEEKDGYYKIAPPDGAYLWVSNQYVKPLGSLVAPPQPTPSAPVYTPPAPPFPSANSVSTPAPHPATPNEPAVLLPDDAQKTREVLALKEKVDAEAAKPLDQQDFTELKKTITEFANNKQTPMAARNAQNLLKNIGRYELVKMVSKAEKLQEEQFGQTQKQIEEARSANLAQIEDRGMFAVIGIIKESSIFAEAPGIKYYRIVDNQGNTICYARASLDMDVNKYLDKKVGLVGTILPNTELGGALVEFTNIVELP